MKNPSLYSKEIMKHFLRPRNMGKLKDPDGIGRVGNSACGDIMELYIKVKKDKNGKERLADISFQTFGCVVAISVSSMLTEIAKGKTIKEAMKISNKDILNKAGKVPMIKIHCSVLAADALKEAIYDYLSKNKKAIPDDLQKDHDRIISTLKQVEKTHKEFTEFEEKILDK